MPSQTAAKNAGVARDLALAAGLVALVALAFGRTVSFSFTGYDDPLYVSANPHVLGGLRLGNVRWAFTTFEAGNWHPLTWLTLMADASLGGANPAVYHATNVLLHAAATVALFLVFRRTTGFAFRSAVVAALFAVHPLHVESVAWIAERKDVLSGFLFFLLLFDYAWYAQRPGPRRMAAVAALLFLGLMAKPMLVTAPLVLLLLDVWPLGRWDLGRSWLPPRQLVVEKLPLVALAAASCVITVIAQTAGGAVVSLQRAPFTARAANAIVAVLIYLAKAVWPAKLAVIYPFPVHGTPTWQALAAGAAVAGATWLAVRAVRRRPFLTVGWLWYLIMLVPVIGLVQVGVQGRADRYTYLPLVGVFVAVTWWVAEVLQARLQPRAARWAAAGLSIAVLVPLLVACMAQVRHWQDRLTLFQHLVKVVPEFPNGHLSLGAELDQRGDREGAKASYLRALQADPESADAHSNLAFWHLRAAVLDQALAHADEVVRLRPSLFEGHLARGRALAGLQRHEEAIESFRRALALNPSLREAWAGLGSELLRLGRTDEALDVLRQGVEDAPNAALLRHDLGVALLRKGKVQEAVEQLQAARTIAPRDVQILTTLGDALLDLERYQEAGVCYQEALTVDPRATKAHFGWGVVLAARGDRQGAASEFELVLQAEPGNEMARQNLAILRATRPAGGGS